MQPDLETLFDAARNLSDPAQRNAFLDAACHERPALRRELAELLAAQAEADGLFEPGAAALDADTVRPTDAPPHFRTTGPNENPGDRIGRYKLLQKIGEGGCGTVYLAEQEEPVKRRVALKVIKLGMDTHSVIARFEAERQALALMDHPNIARVLDGGATEVGRPYFVMELVSGVRISDYCDEHRLTVRQRLQLFIEVGQAVQHAHQKGIIHRDLKPSNILVTIQDGVPVPKVIDFGIAKAIEQKLTDKTVFTAFEQIIGTPAYMSPEQALMTSIDIDTRSDIYSLGVLLYELLTGRTPFDPKSLVQHGVDELRRTIREQEPPRPSNCLRMLGGDAGATAAKRRGIELPKLIHLLRGDLDWIVMKCLEKDRTRRFDDANSLAADIRRFLNDEPVLARPPTSAYRLRKFIVRHRRATAAVALILLTAVTGAIVSTSALIGERAARARADQRLRAALAFADQVFTNLAPEIASLVGATRTQEKLSASGMEFVLQLRADGRDDPDFPLVLARIRIGLSQVQGNLAVANTLGDFAAALTNANEAVRLLRASDPSHRPAERLDLLERAEWQAAMALLGLGRIKEALGHYDEIRRLLDALETYPAFAERAKFQRLTASKNVGLLLLRLGQPREAIERHFRPLLETPWARSVTPHSSAADLELLSNVQGALAFAHENAGEFGAAIAPALEAVQLRELLVRQDSSNALHLAYAAVLRTFAGYPMVRAGRPHEGFEQLNLAETFADGLLAQDPANHKFQVLKIQVASRQARAWTAWSDESDASSPQRRDRLAQAEAYLARAETVVEAMKPRPLSIDAQTFMDHARADVAAAKTRLATPGPSPKL